MGRGRFKGGGKIIFRSATASGRREEGGPRKTCWRVGRRGDRDNIEGQYLWRVTAHEREGGRVKTDTNMEPVFPLPVLPCHKPKHTFVLVGI